MHNIYTNTELQGTSLHAKVELTLFTFCRKANPALKYTGATTILWTRADGYILHPTIFMLCKKEVSHLFATLDIFVVVS